MFLALLEKEPKGAREGYNKGFDRLSILSKKSSCLFCELRPVRVVTVTRSWQRS